MAASSMGPEEEEEAWKRRRGLMLSAAGGLRLLLVAYSEWHDAHMEVPYTDVDYYVFSDAAALVAQGRSPFNRSTYRYTPLLAFVLLPNVWLHRCWGKLLFSAADLLVAHLIWKALKIRGRSEQQCAVSVATWLFNPFTFSVGTRGNCEALVCAMILWLLVCLMTGRLLQAAAWFGLVVHVRIYPIVYVLPILLLLDDNYGRNSEEKPCPSTITEISGPSDADGRLLKSLLRIINRPRICFGAVAGGLFVALSGVFYLIYGDQYLQESLIYHLKRSDHRHNFSIHFYSIYLHGDASLSVAERVVAFVPQMGLQMVLIGYFAKDLPFCFFVQTFAFVAFNKVITAQYFVWFFCLLPLILPSTALQLRWNGLIIVTAWTGAQLHWLGWAYMLEFKGKNVFLPLWMASLTFFAANVLVLSKIIACHSFCPLFLSSRHAHLKTR